MTPSCHKNPRGLAPNGVLEPTTRPLALMSKAMLLLELLPEGTEVGHRAVLPEERAAPPVRDLCPTHNLPAVVDAGRRAGVAAERAEVRERAVANPERRFCQRAACFCGICAEPTICPLALIAHAVSFFEQYWQVVSPKAPSSVSVPFCQRAARAVRRPGVNTYET